MLKDADLLWKKSVLWTRHECPSCWGVRGNLALLQAQDLWYSWKE